MIGTCSTWPVTDEIGRKGAVGGAPFRPERRQDHVADRVVMLEAP